MINISFIHPLLIGAAGCDVTADYTTNDSRDSLSIAQRPWTKDTRELVVVYSTQHAARSTQRAHAKLSVRLFALSVTSLHSPPTRPPNDAIATTNSQQQQ